MKRRERYSPTPPRIEYRQSPNVTDADIQRRLKNVYQTIFDASRRPNDTTLPRP